MKSWHIALAALLCSGCANNLLISARHDAAPRVAADAPVAVEQPDVAAPASGQAAVEQPRPADTLRAAERQWRDGDLDGCEATLAKILRQDPKQRAARRLLADLYASRNEYQQAEHQLRRLLADDPADAQAHHSLGLSLAELGRTADATQHFDEACRLEPDNALYQLSRRRDE
jgi:Flp pilus assembly protein TadD